MKKISKFTFIGGDSRQLYMADYLEKQGYTVDIYSLPKKNRSLADNLSESIRSSQGIILPLPISKDGVYLTSVVPMKETIDDIISLLNDNHIVFGGMVSKPVEARFTRNGIKIYDYFKREEVSVMNAVPTVQGILKAMIENIEYTINSSKCAVFGYGKIAGVTADVLKALGAEVTVCVRKYGDIAKAQIKGFDTCFINDFSKSAYKFDMIVNTVPSLILDKNMLKNLKTDCLIIDVASSPYGTDFAAANELGLNALLCSSLPGKVAPKTAGEIIAKGVLNIIREEFDEQH